VAVQRNLMAAASPPAAWRPRLRLLCLHGRQQSSAVFQHRLDKLVTKAASWAEFTFVDGPEELPLQPSERVNSRSWGLSDPSDPKSSEAASRVIERAWAEQGPFDGVLGFSEGASAALLCCQLADSAVPGLRFAVLAGGPAPPSGLKANSLGLPSLHFASAADTCVPIAASKKLAAIFKDAVFVGHLGGHCFPQRPEEMQKFVAFLQTQRDIIHPSSEAGKSILLDAADDAQRIRAEQLEELDALSAMLIEDEATRVAPAWPVRIAIRINGMEDSVLRFTLPPAYPESCGCLCEFFTERLNYLVHEQDLMSVIEAAREPLGFPSIFSMVQAAQQWVEEHEGSLGAPAGARPRDAGDEEREEDGSEALADKWWLKDEEVDEMALKEAECQAAKLIPDPSQGGRAWARECGASGYGRPWEFVVGLVGKPSAGKSTFFNAATRPERPDREASMAPHPFTTIDPNVSPGWFAAPCPSAQLGFEAQPEHGSVTIGRRRYPLLVKDVAGLVPGAYQGRGRGNAFLNDLIEADSLIHVVDGSGRSDAEGVDQGGSCTPGGGSKSNASTDPLDEVGWVRREIHLWIFCNVRAKFDSVLRRARMGNVAAREATTDRLLCLFTGYHASQQLVARVYEAAGFHLHAIAEDSGVRSWQEYDLHLLVACFLRVRFPITVALNKIDMPEAAVHIPRVCAELGKSCIPVSARAEWWLWDQQRQGHLTYMEGEGAEAVKLHEGASVALRKEWDKIRATVLEPYGSTGVLAALSAAVLQKHPIFVCPVTDFASCESLMRASAAKAVAAPLATMVMMRPISTVEELYSALKHEGMLRGDFVRAEVLDALSASGFAAPPAPSVRVVRREETLKAVSSDTGALQAVVVRVLTNKKSQWQASGYGSGR